MLKNPNEYSLYDLGLGDSINFDDLMYATRVPGGWIFSEYSEDTGQTMSSCFVPFNDEFM